MATLQYGSEVGSALQQMLMAPDIVPGDGLSYQLCKVLMAWHPLGAKMTAAPVKMALSQQREITVQKGVDNRLVEAFRAEWKAIGADNTIANLGTQSRGYGIASMGLLEENVAFKDAVDFRNLYKARISINVFDPLNTAGSLTLNQNPNSLDYQKSTGIAVAGQPYHRSRTITLQNGNPYYILWTNSTFGFTGRSVFQPALFPLKTFVRSMITDDLVLTKAGVLVAKMKPPGSIADRVQQAMQGIKRNFIKEAQVGNVLGITPDEDIQTLNFQNLEGPAGQARKNALDNIATAADMPAIILNQETFAEGFGEGTEDANRVVQYINGIREWLAPAYDWFDRIVMHRAWNPEFYETIQKEFLDRYKGVTYEQAFYEWSTSFSATWPNLHEEPESERVKIDDVRLKAVVAAFEVLSPALDPDNKARLVQWVQDCFNERKELFPSQLDLDMDDLLNYVPPVPAKEPDEPPPFSARDSDDRVGRAMEALTTAVSALPGRPERRRLAAA